MGGHDLALIVVAICGAAGAGAIGALLQGRATAQKVKQEGRAVDAKLPGEVANIAVDGATAAVLVMSKSLEVANEQIDDLVLRVRELEAARAADRIEMEALHKQIAGLRVKVQQADEHLAEARRECEQLATQLEALMKQQDERK